MKISSVLLRWYKSFNINYYGYGDRRQGVRKRAWNGLGLETADADSYRFVEIPLSDSITTIVGANESGKSHLLSAISKVIRGTGIPDDRNEPAFDVTDLCHYASVKDKNAEVWPNIGLEFKCTRAELASVLKAAGKSDASVADDHFTLILHQQKNAAAALYVGDSEDPIFLTEKQLNAVRNELSPVEFIHSDIPLPNEVTIDDLLSVFGTGVKNDKNWFSFESAQAAAALVETLSLSASTMPSADTVDAVTTLQGELKRRRETGGRSQLEAKLFGDILGIKKETFERLARFDNSKRGYVEGIISLWNEELDRKLNLSYYWQQDDKFSLRVNYKDGVFYFEITDKTGAVYTFRERSSGLRFFLSYYIQAKALEHKYRDRGCTIMMDEPDSYLSIAAQKNLLSVFESLVSASAATDKLQVIYTTHSPFLINQNFPNRIRLVRKGDAEEGTQYIDESRLRHYEPVRSALGIDCAQTLFMGETNVVVEGPSDQYAIAELNRLFVMNRNPASFLDLTTLVLMSAESAPGVEKLLSASKWGDERIPATVVLFDGDEEGCKQRDRVTGKDNKGKKLIDPNFVFTIPQAIGSEIDGQKIVTTEDLVPVPLYVEAIVRHLTEWYGGDATEEKLAQQKTALHADTFGKNGLAEAAASFFKEHVHPERDTYDKMGVFHQVVGIVGERLAAHKQDGSDLPAEVATLELRMKKLCEELWRRIDLSQQSTRRESASQAVRREVLDFFKRFKKASPAFDIVRIIGRLTREASELGEDGDLLRTALSKLQHEIQTFRDRGETSVEGDHWKRWSTALWKLKESPLNPEIAEFAQLEIDEAVFDKASGGIGTVDMATLVAGIEESNDGAGKRKKSPARAP